MLLHLHLEAPALRQFSGDPMEAWDDLLALAGAPVGGAAPPAGRRGETGRKEAPTAAESLEALVVGQRSGLVRVPRLLPKKAARRAHELLKSLPEATWHRATRAVDAERGDRGAGSTAHSYSVGDGSADDGGGGGGGASERAVAALLEEVTAAAAPFCRRHGLTARLQLARYGRGDYIEAHDDAAETTIDGVRHARVLAVVYYLTGEEPWAPNVHGGCFLDREANAAIAPRHNSLVAFRVPRLHEVQMPTSDRPRYSVFGWLYARVGAEKRPKRPATAPPDEGAKRKKKKKKKKKPNSKKEAAPSPGGLT